VLRDVSERGREVQGVIYQYNRFVKPAFDNYIKLSAKVANIIVPGGHDNSVAINFICKNLRSEISKFEDLRDSVKSNVYHTDILDSRWLNIPENPEHLETADRIIYLRDPSSKSECIKLFNLFSAKFSKSLYQ
jgi:Phosphoribulokinase / Uridine kinase family